MTDQISDKLSVEYPGLSLEGWRLYGVITGDPARNYGWGEPYPFRHKPSPPENVQCSALWRGYVASYQLAADGRLWLTGFEYPFSHVPPQAVSEPLEGDFFLVLKMHFRARRMYLPFVASTVVADPAQWLHEADPDADAAPAAPGPATAPPRRLVHPQRKLENRRSPAAEDEVRNGPLPRKRYEEHVTDYVLKHFRHWMTDTERAAEEAFVLTIVCEGSKEQQIIFKMDLTGPEMRAAEAALRDGVPSFRRRTRERIVSEHRAEVFANACPQCGRLPATPKAKMCLWCPHTWRKLP